MSEIILARDKWARIKEEREKTKDDFKAFSGVPSLDAATEGFRLGQLIVLSGPTGHGKTTFSRTLTKNFIDAGHNVCWFSYEESYEELFEKSPSVDYYVPETLEMDTVEWIKEHMLKAKAKGAKIMFIDNLDFLRNPKDMRKVDMNMSSYVGSIVQELKQFAVQHQVVIFLLVHITKNNWTSNELPTSQDIRDSGQIPQLASYVLFIIRFRAKEGPEIFTNEALLGIDKNRHNGKTRKIGMVYVPEQKIFIEETVDTWFEEQSKQTKMTWDTENPRSKGRA